MKLKRKILAGILAVNFSVIGIGASTTTNTAYAASQSIVNQRAQLQRAVDDVINIVNTDVYYNYTSQGLKAKYEQAVGNAKALLALGDEASLKDLQDATRTINSVVDEIYNETALFVRKSKLEDAISRNKTQVRAAQMLLDLYPATVKNVRSELIAAIDKANTLVARAEAILAQL